MTDPLDSAISTRVEIEFRYDGHQRIVQPAAHGLHKSTGNDVLRGYQVGGTSSSRTPPLWDLFKTSKVDDLVLTDRHFSEDPPGYARGDKHMSTIYTEL